MEAKPHRLRLGVNIDHVATIRNARGGSHPDPFRAAQVALAAGADIITAHLREDRRHIIDRDVDTLIRAKIPLNLEMAATSEMLSIAVAAHPLSCCIVPERREERTTEGGLDVVGNRERLHNAADMLKHAGIAVTLFIEPDLRQVTAARDLGVECVEFHTGAYANAVEAGAHREADRLLDALRHAAAEAARSGIEVHAGHGLTFDNILAVAAILQVSEFQIGHFLIGEAVFSGLENVIGRMRKLLDESR
jgi:pyridoxine 5-phosphate synthase